jgi:hypothetical protein
MKNINKIFAVLFTSMFLMSGVALAQTNGYGCIGSGCGNVTGSLDISTFAAGGGIDADAQLARHGAAAGISAAGGLTVGEAEGTIKTFKIFKKTFAGGSVEASIDSIGGGLTKTEAGKYTEDGLKHVYSASDSYAVTGADMDLKAFGVAAVEGCVFGVAGQASLDGSIMFNHGVSAGIAGQYSAGYFVGGAGVVGFGSAGVDAKIEMNGQSGSDSYRGVFHDGPATTRVLGTNVYAATEVTSYGYNYDCGLSESFLAGGWQAGGAASAKTIQISNGGIAKAEANGSYSGAGSLGCNFEGSAVGGTQTSATTVQGYNGSVMTSSAAMKVSAKTGTSPAN